jgi:hypothetical protein
MLCYPSVLGRPRAIACRRSAHHLICAFCASLHVLIACWLARPVCSVCAVGSSSEVFELRAQLALYCRSTARKNERELCGKKRTKTRERKRPVAVLHRQEVPQKVKGAVRIAGVLCMQHCSVGLLSRARATRLPCDRRVPSARHRRSSGELLNCKGCLSLKGRSCPEPGHKAAIKALQS